MSKKHDFEKLLSFIERLPAIELPAGLKSIGFGSYDNGNWWLKFFLDTGHELAWRHVQELGHVLNYLSVEERLPAVFMPVSPPPYMNGGVEFLSWIIESRDPKFTPDNAQNGLKAGFRGRSMTWRSGRRKTSKEMEPRRVRGECGNHQTQSRIVKSMVMALKETLAKLESLGDEKVRARNSKNGAGKSQFGVPLGDIRKLAEKIKTNDDLAAALWGTGNVDAQLLAILLITPRKLSLKELDGMVRSARFSQVADWLNSYIVKNHPEKESLRQSWIDDDDPWAARAGWSLMSGRVARDADGIDLPALLDRIESEMGNAAPEVQWTMNSCLAGIGIHHPKHRKRAIAIGEKLGVYRDYPVSKGCTSPFAPLWIKEMVRRQG